MRLIYNPAINYFLRTVLSPFKKLIPKKYHFPVNGKVNVKLPEGKGFIFAGNQTSPHTTVMYWQGVKGFEYGTLPVFIHLIKQSNCFFDIGANIGYYSLVAAAFNKKAIIHAFEPLPSANKFLRKNVELNNFKNIIVSNAALSNSNGTAKFFSHKNPKYLYVEDHLMGDSSLVAQHEYGSTRFEFDVNTKTLDDYAIENLGPGVKIDLLKIDTEGSENLVFDQAKNVLKEHRPIIMCEIIRGGIEKEVDAQLSAYNYEFYLITEKGLKPQKNINAIDVKEDYFCVPAEKRKLIEQFII